MQREWIDPSLQDEALRAALRAAERVLRVALSLTDARRPGDRVPARDLNDALSLVMERRLQLENGHWPDREVSPHPIHDPIHDACASVPAETDGLDRDSEAAERGGHRRAARAVRSRRADDAEPWLEVVHDGTADGRR